MVMPVEEGVKALADTTPECCTRPGQRPALHTAEEEEDLLKLMSVGLRIRLHPNLHLSCTVEQYERLSVFKEL